MSLKLKYSANNSFTSDQVCVFFRCLTFSLALSSSNICWISSLQSSCKEWKDSRGIWNMADCSMASSRLRMLVKEGLLRGFGLQHSDGRKDITEVSVMYYVFNGPNLILYSGKHKIYLHIYLHFVWFCFSATQLAVAMFLFTRQCFSPGFDSCYAIQKNGANCFTVQRGFQLTLSLKG